MKVIAKRPILFYGRMYSPGDIIDGANEQQISRWAANGAVGLMGAKTTDAASVPSAGTHDKPAKRAKAGD